MAHRTHGNIHLHLPVHPKRFYKGCKLAARCRDAQHQVWEGSQAGASITIKLEGTTLLARRSVTNLEVHHPIVQDFCGGYAVNINSISSPSLLPTYTGMQKVPNWGLWFGLFGDQPLPRSYSRCHPGSLIRLQYTLIRSPVSGFEVEDQILGKHVSSACITHEITKVLGALCQELGLRPKVFLLSHSSPLVLWSWRLTAKWS